VHVSWLTFDDLSETECWLANAVVSGTRLELDQPAEVRAELIRQIMIGGFHWPDRLTPDPRGIRLRGAIIVGELELTEVRSALPLQLSSCRAEEGIRLTGSQLSAVDLCGLVAPGLVANEAVIERSLLMAGAQLNTVNVYGARIGGTVNLSGTILRGNGGEIPLLADHLRTGGGLFLNHGFQADGGGDGGAVRLSGAVIGGLADLGTAQLTNSGGPALVADYLRTESNLMLNQGFRARGVKDTGTIRLVGASIGGRLNFEDGQAIAVVPGALALNISRVSVGGDALFPVSFLDGAINLDGFTYSRIRRASVPEFLDLLANRPNGYASQPYHQFAATHQAAGNERDVRRINIAAQRELLRGGSLDFWTRIWHRVTGVVLGYGYRPSRALLWWAGTVALALALLVGVAGPAGLITVGAHGARCGTVDQAGLALNTATPLVKPAGRQDCQLDGGTTLGDLLTVTSWVIQALSWAFVTLFVAGFTGLVRKNP
jgi:uncharacterized protein YjbI with pentapeptide repeats